MMCGNAFLPQCMLGTLPRTMIDAFVLQFPDFGFPMVAVALLHMQLPMMIRYHNTVRLYGGTVHLVLTLTFFHQGQPQTPSMCDPNGLLRYECAALHNDCLRMKFRLIVLPKVAEMNAVEFNSVLPSIRRPATANMRFIFTPTFIEAIANFWCSSCKFLANE